MGVEEGLSDERDPVGRGGRRKQLFVTSNMERGGVAPWDSATQVLLSCHLFALLLQLIADMKEVYMYSSLYHFHTKVCHG